MTLRFPAMRANFQGFTEGLGDAAHQRRVWIEGHPSAVRDSFTDVVHFFYDDISLASEPEAWLGLVLQNDAEVEAVCILTAALDAVFAEVGTEAPDEAYVEAQGWPRVVQDAEDLLALLDEQAETPPAAAA